MASTCHNCAAECPQAQTGPDSNMRCKPCEQYLGHQPGHTGEPGQIMERPWYLWDTADAIARHLLPEFQKYARRNPGQNPFVKPHQAVKLCRVGCGNITTAKRSSLCSTCKQNQRLTGTPLPRTWPWLRTWSEQFTTEEILAFSSSFRKSQSEDPNEYYRLDQAFDKQPLKYYHFGYAAAFEATKLDASPASIKEPPKSKSVNSGKPGSKQADTVVISDDDAPDTEEEAPRRTSRRLRGKTQSVPIMQDDDESDSLADGSLIYAPSAASSKRRRAQPHEITDSEFECDDTPGRSCSTPSFLSGSSSRSALTLVANTTPETKLSMSVAPKTTLPKSISQQRITINPSFSFMKADGNAQEVMQELLPDIQKAIAEFTITAATTDVPSCAPAKGSTMSDNASHTVFALMDAGTQTDPPHQHLVGMTTASAQTQDSFREVGGPTVDTGAQTSAIASPSNKKRKLGHAAKPRIVLKSQTAGLRGRNEDDSDDELNDSMEVC